MFNAERAERRRGIMPPDVSEEENMISGVIVDSSLQVHRLLGPGLLEKAYEEALCYFLTKQGIRYERQKELPLYIEGNRLDAGFRLDLLVEKKIIVELKSVEKILPVHQAQLYTYLKLSGLPLGLMVNFNVKLLRDGIHRMAMTR